MNIKFLATLSLFFIFFTCKKTQENGLTEDSGETTSQEITEKDLSNLNYIEFTLDVKTEKVVADWTEYNELQDIITNVKKGDLSYFDNEEKLISELIKNLKQNIRTEVDSDATLARIAALETKLYKLKSLSNLSTTSKQELIAAITAFLESFSNLNFQMNKKIEKDNQKIEKP